MKPDIFNPEVWIVIDHLLYYLQGLGFYISDTWAAPRNRKESIESLWGCSTVQGPRKIPPQKCNMGLQEISVAFLPQDSLPLWSLAGTRKNSALLLTPYPQWIMKSNRTSRPAGSYLRWYPRMPHFDFAFSIFRRLGLI